MSRSCQVLIGQILCISTITNNNNQQFIETIIKDQQRCVCCTKLLNICFWLTFQAPVFGAHRSSQPASSSGGSRHLFHKESQSHDVCQCSHCELKAYTDIRITQSRLQTWAAFWFSKDTKNKHILKYLKWPCFGCQRLFWGRRLKSLSIWPRVCQDCHSLSAVEKVSSDIHVTWLNQRKVKSFYRGVVATELRSGVNMLLQVRMTLYSIQIYVQMKCLL